jgi:hypothetical protein
MSGGAPEPENGTSDASQRARLAVVLGAAFLLVAIVVVVMSTRSSDKESDLVASTCFKAWNEDLIAPRQDGIHAYTTHGYRQTLVTRVDRDVNVIGLGDDSTPADDPAARCTVIFASPQGDSEPDFGVRVFDKGRWTGLALSDRVPLEEIAALQAEAVADSNALLVSNGTLEDG